MPTKWIDMMYSARPCFMKIPISVLYHENGSDEDTVGKWLPGGILVDTAQHPWLYYNIMCSTCIGCMCEELNDKLLLIN